MNEITASIALMVVLLALLGGGVWVGLTLAGVAWFGMEFFTARAVDTMESAPRGRRDRSGK